MILFDTPRKTTFRGFRRTAHCASTRLGEAGTAELLAFGRRIGLREAWLQNRGQPNEHFDLFDSRIEAALQAGAVQTTPRGFITKVVWSKRLDSERDSAVD